MSAPNPNTETRTAMQDTVKGKGLSGPHSTTAELFAALNSDETNK